MTDENEDADLDPDIDPDIGEENDDVTPEDSDQPLPDSMPGATPHQPIFSHKARTVIYVICIIAAVVGAILYIWGAARGVSGLETAGDIIDTIAAIVAAAFGVAYNPIRNLFS